MQNFDFFRKIQIQGRQEIQIKKVQNLHLAFSFDFLASLLTTAIAPIVFYRQMPNVFQRIVSWRVNLK